MPPSPPRGTPVPDLLYAQARADLAAGRWRKARDAFKELCKGDRATFQPLLVEANVGLARAMLAKGLISDARQVLSYLRRIASPATITALDAEIAACAAKSPSAAPDPVALLADGALAPDEQRRVADQLVVAFTSGSIDTASPASAQVVADLRAIHQAIESVCHGDHERAMEYVRPLKRESVFAHWRLFVRAVAAFQRGDADKAVQYFEELPASSVPGRACDAWLLALGKQIDTGRGAESEAVLEAAGTLAGEPGWGRALARAEVMWRAGRHASSYRAVAGAKGSFPSDGADFCSALSAFFFNAIFALPEDQRYEYADALSEIEVSRRGTSPTELMLIRRTLSLLYAADGTGEIDPSCLQGIWEAFLRDHQRIHGTNPRLASAGLCWLGKVLAQPRPHSLRHRPRAKRDRGGAAIAVLEKSIELDPGNVDAHLLLASLYGTGSRARDRNRLLDLIAVRFPDHKEALLAVGAGCVDRKANAKALEYYERALTIDRLDPAMPDLVATACLLLAAQFYQKGKLPAARQALTRADELAVDHAEHFVRSRWCLEARRAVLEMMYGDASVGAVALDEARASSPSRAACLFFVRLAWSFYYSRSLHRLFPAPLKAELAQEATRESNGRDAVTLVQLWRYWGTGGNSRARTMDEEGWLRRYLKGAAKTSMARDDASRLLELLRAFPEFGQEARAVVARALKGDRADPLFLLYRELLQPFPRLGPVEYESILAEARRRGDDAAERLARELDSHIAGSGSPPFAQPWDDSGLDEFEDDDDVAEDILGSPEVAAFIDLLAAAPPGEVAKMRKKRPQWMPMELFEMLLTFARAGRGNPDQGDLF